MTLVLWFLVQPLSYSTWLPNFVATRSLVRLFFQTLSTVWTFLFRSPPFCQKMNSFCFNVKLGFYTHYQIYFFTFSSSRCRRPHWRSFWYDHCSKVVREDLTKTLPMRLASNLSFQCLDRTNPKHEHSDLCSRSQTQILPHVIPEFLWVDHLKLWIPVTKLVFVFISTTSLRSKLIINQQYFWHWRRRIRSSDFHFFLKLVAVKRITISTALQPLRESLWFCTICNRDISIGSRFSQLYGRVSHVRKAQNIRFIVLPNWPLAPVRTQNI